MSGVWNNPLAYQTGRLIAIIASLPEEEYSDVVRKLVEGGDAELIAFHWGAFNIVVYNWALFEEECRARKKCDPAEYLPEGVGPDTAASFFGNEVRRLVANACIDLAPDWVVPSWVRWFASRYGLDLSTLRSLGWGELLGRLVDFAVYVWGLRGISQSHLEFYQIEGMEYATAVASHVHWEIVEATAEPIEAALEPLKIRFSVRLEALRKTAFNATMRFIESGGKERLGLLDVARETLRKLRLALLEIIEDARATRQPLEDKVVHR